MKKTDNNKGMEEIIHPLDNKKHTQDATNATTTSQKKKPKQKAAPTAKEQTTPSSDKLTEEDKKQIETLAHALGLPQIVEAIQQNRATLNQIVGKTGDDKTSKEKNPLSGILDHPVAKKLVDHLDNYLTGGEGKTKGVDQKVMRQSQIIYQELMKKRMKALDLISENFVGGGQIKQDLKGNILITRPPEQPKTEEKSK